MIGKTNSIVVKGGDTPTPATTDRYKGLRPSYWPKIKMPDEFPNDNYIHTQLLLWIPAVITNGDQTNVQLFTNTTGLIKVDWGDSISNSSPYIENSHLYTTYTPTDAPRGNFYVVEITSTALPNYYDGSHGDYYKYEILEMSCRCNIEKQWDVIDGLSEFYANPYIKFISVHNKDGNINFQTQNFHSLLLYPYLKSDVGFIYTLTAAYFTGGSLIEVPIIRCFNLYIGSGKYSSLPISSTIDEEKLTYSLISIEGILDTETFSTYPSALDVLPIPDIGTSYDSLFVQPSQSPLECLAIADLSQLSVEYSNNGQENYTSEIWGRSKGCVFSPKVSISSNDTSAKGIFRGCKNLQEATIVSWGGLSNEDGLQNAFYGCQNLQIVRMPENSLKVPIDLSNITQTYSVSYTDPATGNSYNSTTDFLIQTLAKGLYNFTAAGETPSYTPTLTLSNNINFYASSIYIDGTQFPEYVANKGWTIAEA